MVHITRQWNSKPSSYWILTRKRARWLIPNTSIKTILTFWRKIQNKILHIVPCVQIMYTIMCTLYAQFCVQVLCTISCVHVLYTILCIYVMYTVPCKCSEHSSMCKNYVHSYMYMFCTKVHLYTFCTQFHGLQVSASVAKLRVQQIGIFKEHRLKTPCRTPLAPYAAAGEKRINCDIVPIPCSASRSFTGQTACPAERNIQGTPLKTPCRATLAPYAAVG